VITSIGWESRWKLGDLSTRSDLSPLLPPIIQRQHPLARRHPPASANGPGPTTARCGRLLHATASSVAGASLSSSTPQCGRFLQLQPGVAGSSTQPPLPLQPAPPCRRLLCNSGRWLWTSPTWLPPLDATSRLGPPPPDAID
jgi:hypothetical protein